jgi:hypothetical protein
MHTSEAVYGPSRPLLAVTIKLVPDSTRYAMSAPLCILFSVSESFDQLNPSGDRKVLSFIEFQTERMESLNSFSVSLWYPAQYLRPIAKAYLERSMFEPSTYTFG